MSRARLPRAADGERDAHGGMHGDGVHGHAKWSELRITEPGVVEVEQAVVGGGEEVAGHGPMEWKVGGRGEVRWGIAGVAERDVRKQLLILRAHLAATQERQMPSDGSLLAGLQE